MEMYDVKRFATKDVANTSPLEPRAASLMREQWREPTVTALQWVDGDVGMCCAVCFWFTRMQCVIRIDTVNDVHLVPLVTQRMSQPMEIDRIPPETVRGVERGQVQNLHQADAT
jgi:hypothetical protein